MNKIIYKELSTQEEVTDVVLPKGSTVLMAEGTKDGLFLHALVPTEHTEEEVIKAHVFMDNVEIGDGLTYLNSDRAMTYLSTEKAKELYPEQFEEIQNASNGMDGLAQMLESVANMAGKDEEDEAQQLMKGMRKKFEEINQMVKDEGHQATMTFHVFLENK
jgi:hypothetical protein